MRKIIVSLILGCMLSLVIFYSLNTKSINAVQEANEPMGKLYDSDFNKLSRVEQIKKCGECHKSEYKNELEGPHYAATAALMGHKSFVNSDKYKCSFYTDFVNKNYSSACFGCHASVNLFESTLKTYKNSDSLSAALLSCNFFKMTARDNINNQSTGVDCITCHFDGKGVLSGNEKYKQPSTAPCNPKYASFLKNISMSCYPCHFDETKTWVNINGKYPDMSISCNTCHEKQDSKGVGTHFYYWTREKRDDQNKVYSQLVDDFSIQDNKANGNSYIKWINKSVPHILGLCPELIIKFEVLDINSVVLGKVAIRVNRKKEYDKIIYENIDKHSLPGLFGDDIPPYGEERTYLINIRNRAEAKTLKIEISKKAQYWFPDSLGMVTFSKVKSLN